MKKYILVLLFGLLLGFQPAYAEEGRSLSDEIRELSEQAEQRQKRLNELSGSFEPITAEEIERWRLDREVLIQAERDRLAKLPCPRIGMTKAQALKSCWGRPESVNRTITAHSVTEQWVYGYSSYLYFTNGRLTAIQD